MSTGCDVIVIGAGFAGLSAAGVAARQGLRVWAVIVATGARLRKLGIPGAAEFEHPRLLGRDNIRVHTETVADQRHRGQGGGHRRAAAWLLVDGNFWPGFWNQCQHVKS